MFRLFLLSLYVKIIQIKDKILSLIWGPKITKDGVIVSYYFRKKWFNIMFPLKRGLSTYINCNNEHVNSFIGPNKDFHRQEYKPSDFGLSEITVTFEEENIIFNKNDVIKLDIHRQ